MREILTLRSVWAYLRVLIGSDCYLIYQVMRQFIIKEKVD